MKSSTRALVFGAWLFCMDVASSHHAFSPVYDASRTVTISGVVTEFRLVNPHARMTVDVRDGAGNVVTWEIEFAGRLNLTNAGWSDDTISAGERAVVTGNPTHTGSSRMFFVRLERADGTVLEGPGATRIEALEEQRRQRRQSAPVSP